MADATIEQNKAIVRKMLDAFNEGNTAVVAELFDRDIRDNGASLGLEQELKNAHPIKRVQTEILREEDVFPDRRFEEEVLVAEGDTVVLRWRMTGTNTKQLLGRKPTGKKVDTHGVEIVRIRNGKIVEHISDNGQHFLQVLFQLDLLQDRDLMQKVRASDPALAQGHRTASV
jgi:predicted ester cyclase